MRSQLLLGIFALAQQALSGVALEKGHASELEESQQLRLSAEARALQKRSHHNYPEDDHHDDYYYDDDYYYYYGKGKGKGGKSSKGGKGKGGKGKGGKKGKSSKKGKGKGGDDGGGARSRVLVTAETVSPPANEVIGPNGIGQDPLELGSVYVFSNRTRNIENLNMFEFPAFANGQEAEVLGMVDGYCTRTGEMINSIIAYCHFTYSLFDASDMELLGTVVAQGAFPPSPTAAVLAVTGGTGYFVGATGLVEVVGCLLDESVDPPLLIPSDETTDVLYDVGAYVHYIEFEVDEFFFSGEGAPDMPVPL